MHYRSSLLLKIYSDTLSTIVATIITYFASILLPAVMKLKTQIKIYQRLLSKPGRKYDVSEDFISSRRKELCLEHGILEKEICLLIFFMLLIKFSY